MCSTYTPTQELLPTINSNLESSILGETTPCTQKQSFDVNSNDDSVPLLHREWRIIMKLVRTRIESSELIRRQLRLSNIDLEQQVHRMQREIRRAQNNSAKQFFVKDDEIARLHEEARATQQRLQQMQAEHKTAMSSLQSDFQCYERKVKQLEQHISTLKSREAVLAKRLHKEERQRIEIESALKEEKRRNRSLELQLTILKSGSTSAQIASVNNGTSPADTSGSTGHITDTNDIQHTDGSLIYHTAARSSEEGHHPVDGSFSQANVSWAINRGTGSQRTRDTQVEPCSVGSPPPIPSPISKSASFIDKEVEMAVSGQLSESDLMARLIERDIAAAQYRGMR